MLHRILICIIFLIAEFTANRDQELLEIVGESHTNSRQIYGSPRIHDDLKADYKRVGCKRISRIVKENATWPLCKGIYVIAF